MEFVSCERTRTGRASGTRSPLTTKLTTNTVDSLDLDRLFGVWVVRRLLEEGEEDDVDGEFDGVFVDVA